MSNSNKSYRIRANVNSDEQYVNIDFTQNYDTLDILSLQINQKDSYHLMNSNTGVVVGRVLANGGYGIPNAKLSVFISYSEGDEVINNLEYRYKVTTDKNYDDIRYNLLPNEKSDSCEQAVGTFPSKRYVLDNDDVIEVFDKYYSYTTRTNNSGDYMIYGVPVGTQTIHCDIDLSDIGILSQRPSDMIYKGYDINQFESPSKFKKDTNLSYLSQIITNDKTIYVYPFWGDTTDDTSNAAITRCDIDVTYKFEPTCVFLGSVITDTGDNAITKKCVPSKVGGKMSDMTTGSGMIEMIRKTYNGDIEQIAVKGNEVIDDNGTWCYQIPMNLDYVMTNEYGETVASDNPSKGIPTRARVRFRISLHENPSDGAAKKRARYLVPNNPHLISDEYPEYYKTKEVDYEFGSKTKDEDFRDLMWNNVYTVKNYIPRIQKARLPNNLKFLGIKMVNHPNQNNPMPYNKLSIKFNFMYTFMCTLIKTLVQLTRFVNIALSSISYSLYVIGRLFTVFAYNIKKIKFLSKLFWRYDDKTAKDAFNNNCGFLNYEMGKNQRVALIEGTVRYFREAYRGNKNATLPCNDDIMYDNFIVKQKKYMNSVRGLGPTFIRLSLIIGSGITLDGLCEDEDGNSISITPGVIDACVDLWGKGIDGFSGSDSGESDDDGDDAEGNGIEDGQMKCYDYNNKISELYNCVENQLAQENEVTSFNFYNDWVNGVLYMPLWFRKIKKKRKFLFIKLKSKDQWCDGSKTARGLKRRKLKVYGNCVIERSVAQENSSYVLQPLADDFGTASGKTNDETGREDLEFSLHTERNCFGYNCHKYGRSETPIVSGLIIEKETILGQNVYYYKPAYYNSKYNSETVTLFATDIVLLGSLKSNDLHGIPQFFKILEGTSYQMPTDLVSESYEYQANADTENAGNTDENESNLIDESTRKTESTGADWGNLGTGQSGVKSGNAERFDVNENIYDNGGLFYGITCFDSFTKPKSIINLERICEIGVSLDESQEILTSKTTLEDEDFDENDEDLFTDLTPDGYISYDDIYNHDYRSMFATLNGNRLKTKFNSETGLTEYDLTHVYLNNFDGSLKNIMSGGATQGNMKENGSISDTKKANYANNYKLEAYDYNYVDFRYGNYNKVNSDHNIYFYEYQKHMTTYKNNYVFSANKIPRYENSFYFYFGLSEGKTAIDRFYSTYYADCGEETTMKKVYTIEYVGNDWCTGLGGYIKFNCPFDLPLTMTMENTDGTIYTCENITKEKFYVGAVTEGLSGYTRFKLKDDNGVEITTIPHTKYKIVVTDVDGDEYEQTINFKNENVIEFEVEKTDFNLSNDDMIENYTKDIDYSSVYRIYSTEETSNVQDAITIKKEIEDSYKKYNYIGCLDNDIYLTETIATEGATPTYSYKQGYGGFESSSEVPMYAYARIAEEGLVMITDDEYKLLNDDDKAKYIEITYNNYTRYILKNTTEINRKINGYIKVHNISFDSFMISIEPTTPSTIGGFSGCKLYVCKSIDSKNNTTIELISKGCGLIGVNLDYTDMLESDFYFGFPYGEMKYKVTVTMLCEDSEGFKESANTSKTTITVYEGYIKMYLNGIDYDLLSKFKTGWSNFDLAQMNTTFTYSNMKGWNDATNIGLKLDSFDVSGTTYPALYPISYNESIGFNQNIICSIARYLEKEAVFKISININENETTDNDSDASVETLGTTSNSVTLDPTKYKTTNKTPYNWTNEYVLKREDWSEYIPSSEETETEKKKKLDSICDMINDVIEKRLDITYQVMGSFRPNSNGATSIEITYSTKSTPVKYLVLNNLTV